MSCYPSTRVEVCVPSRSASPSSHSFLAFMPVRRKIPLYLRCYGLLLMQVSAATFTPVAHLDAWLLPTGGSDGRATLLRSRGSPGGSPYQCCRNVLNPEKP